MPAYYLGPAMTIDFTCRKCDASFELDFDDLNDGSEKLVCPNCDAAATAAMVEEFTAALTEMRAQVAKLSRKFGVNLSIETDDESEEEEEEDEDFEDDEDDEDYDDDEDEDEDLDDEEEDFEEDEE
jgi:hypothetical protein